MNRDDDTFFEDDNEEEDEEYRFPDEDEEEETEEIEEADYEDIEDSRYEERGERFSGFLIDPWPRIVFVLTIIGLGIVLLTPQSFWAIWNYFIIANYFLIILVGVTIVFSLKTWEKAGTERIRWAGPTNVTVALLCGSIGSLDTASWILSGTGLFAGIDTPLISLCMVLTIFSLYTLWLAQRGFSSSGR